MSGFCGDYDLDYQGFFSKWSPPHILCFQWWEVGVEFPLARVQTDRVQTETTPGCRMVTGWLSSLTSFIIKPLLLCIFKSPSGFIKEHRHWPSSLFYASWRLQSIPLSQISRYFSFFDIPTSPLPSLGAFLRKTRLRNFSEYLFPLKII